MAAFSSSSSSSFQSSILLPQSSTIDKMCALLEDPNSSEFPQFYQTAKTLQSPEAHIISITKPPNFEASSVLSTAALNKTSMDSSSVVIDYELCHSKSTDFLTQNHPRKRKSKPQSKRCELSGVEMKKQKKTKESEETKKMKLGKEEKMKATDGYIHVRARRGQATDSHSLAERVRRERISERMRLLQALVPGCDKVTGKALMLDEIINYVQSLQNQVEVLSMKLASINPMFYNFGMNLDSFPDQNLNDLASPLEQSSHTTFLDNSVNPLLLFQQPQIFPNDLYQVFWDEQQQREEMMKEGMNE